MLPYTQAIVKKGPRYRKQHKVGEGGFGEVWCAWDMKRMRLVALKYAREEESGRVEALAREARNLFKNGAHEHVVRLFGTGNDDGRRFLVLEWCGGGDLSAWVTDRKPWQYAVLAVIQACDGLAAVHAHGGYHRDIKPPNLLIGRSHDNTVNVVKVADLGIARIPTNPNALLTRGPGGTPGYTAPEILLGYQFTAAADIYSMGVVLCELLTGTRNPQQLASPGIPQDIANIVRVMMNPWPQHRPGAAEVRDALADHLVRLAPEMANVRDVVPESFWSKAIKVGAAIAVGVALLSR